MDYRTILCAQQDGVAVITLNRPEVMNALNVQMRAELLHALRALAQPASGARVVVLTGAGRSFCSGQDLGMRARSPRSTSRGRCATNTSRCWRPWAR